MAWINKIGFDSGRQQSAAPLKSSTQQAPDKAFTAARASSVRMKPSCVGRPGLLMDRHSNKPVRSSPRSARARARTPLVQSRYPLSHTQHKNSQLRSKGWVVTPVVVPLGPPPNMTSTNWSSWMLSSQFREEPHNPPQEKAFLAFCSTRGPLFVRRWTVPPLAAEKESRARFGEGHAVRYHS